MKAISLTLLLGLFFSLFGQSSDADFRANYTLLPSSSIGFNGSSTINTFFCGSVSMEGSGWGNFSPTTGALQEKNAKLILAVKKLDCGSELMNDDMYEALKSDSNPFIEFELIKASLVDSSNINSNVFYINTIGNLRVAGKSQKIQLVFKVENISSNNYRILGSKKLSMYDFGIKPPSALFGLIKADDTLEVKFDLVARVDLEPRFH